LGAIVSLLVGERLGRRNRKRQRSELTNCTCVETISNTCDDSADDEMGNAIFGTEQGGKSRQRSELFIKPLIIPGLTFRTVGHRASELTNCTCVETISNTCDDSADDEMGNAIGTGLELLTLPQRSGIRN
jgi:hypothetical protein